MPLDGFLQGMASFGEGLERFGQRAGGSYDEIMRKKDEEWQRGNVIDAIAHLNDINQNRPERAMERMANQLTAKQGAGKGISESLAVGDMLMAGDLEGARAEFEDVVRGGIAKGLIKEDDQIKGILNFGSKNKTDINKSFQPVTLINDETGEKKLVAPIVTDDGKAYLENYDIPEGFRVSMETAEEKRRADRLANRNKFSDEENFTYISEGQTSADNLAQVRRGIDLLKQVETGGTAGLSLKAKNFFGIENADEAEVSNILSTNVLKQLKPTFGSQFTADEGKMLIDIQANIGKSQEGNLRLLERTLEIYRRGAKRGIDSALAIEDYAAAARIKEAMDFRLGMEEFADDVGGQRNTGGILPPSGGGLSPEQAQRLEVLRQKRAAGTI